MGLILYKEKIENYLNHDQKIEELGFDNSRLSYIPEYFSSYVEQERILILYVWYPVLVKLHIIRIKVLKIQSLKKK